MSIGKTRGILYKIAKFLGDFSAVSSGYPKKIAKRVGRRTAGKATGKVFRKLFSKASQRTSNKKKEEKSINKIEATRLFPKKRRIQEKFVVLSYYKGREYFPYIKIVIENEKNNLAFPSAG